MNVFIYTDEERFWDQVEKTPEGCWLWTGLIHPTSGYGWVYLVGQGRQRTAHRLAWVFSGRVMAKHKQLHHRCRVRHCVNPAHLQPMTSEAHMKLHWQTWR